MFQQNKTETSVTLDMPSDIEILGSHFSLVLTENDYYGTSIQSKIIIIPHIIMKSNCTF